VEFSLRYRLSETLITLLTINASTFERYQMIGERKGLSLAFFGIHIFPRTGMKLFSQLMAIAVVMIKISC
jgi:hypothetical protein